MKAVRKKAFIGTTAMLLANVIPALISAGSQVYGAKKNADAMKEANANNLFAQNFNNSLNQQQNLRSIYNNQGELDLLNRFDALPTLNQFKCGGMKIKRK
jgi:hypothetical protein